MNTRLDRSRLNIGAYYLAPYAGTDAHVRDLAACGIDVVINMRHDRAALDLLHRYGVGAVVSGIVPSWFGGDGSNAGTMEASNPLSRYDSAADAFTDHPAIWGIDAGDEPSSLDFPHYGRVIERIRLRFPHQFAYLNIYPCYALKGSNTAEDIRRQLGTGTYAQYIERYVQCVPTDYICFDYYLYSASLSGLYESLCTVSDACRQAGRSLFMVLQVNSSHPEVWISERQLRFQAYSALCFGAEMVIWACYTAGWWHNHVLDRQGGKTEQYEKLKAVNAELHALGAVYMAYRRVDTHFVGFGNAECLQNTGRFSVNALDAAGIFALHAEGGERLVVGEMIARSGDGSAALLILAADDPAGERPHDCRIVFRTNRSVRVLMGARPLLRHEGDLFSFPLSSCQGAMILLQ